MISVISAATNIQYQNFCYNHKCCLEIYSKSPTIFLISLFGRVEEKYIKDGNDIPNVTYRLLATKDERIMNSLDSLSFIALRILFLESSPQYMRKYEKGMRRYRCDSKQHANWIIRNSERRITYSATDKDLFIHKTIGNEEELLKEIHRLVKL